MHKRLASLMHQGTPDEAAIDEFVAANEFPMVDGPDVTFVYRGEADEVSLRNWIYGLRAVQPLRRLPGTDLWSVTLELRGDSRIEYKYEVVIGSRRDLVLDPLNPVLAHDPFGANSVCRGHQYERPEWTRHDPASREGELRTLEVRSRHFGNRRKVKLYVPARFRQSRRYPLLLVHDGDDYLNFSSLKIVLDNLIHRLEIPPLIVALTNSPDRLIEYAGDKRHARFLCEELVPLLENELPLSEDPALRALMGASFGAVASLHTAWQFPGRFDRLLLQSGSFAFSDIGEHDHGPTFDPVVRFVNAFRENPGRPARRIYMCCGVYESLIYQNRSMVPLLQAHDMQVRFEEARDAHNWEHWRDRLRSGLSWLFPGPLWMVYE